MKLRAKGFSINRALLEGDFRFWRSFETGWGGVHLGPFRISVSVAKVIFCNLGIEGEIILRLSLIIEDVLGELVVVGVEVLLGV
jgi:hypothetical protein